jgi:glycosyltransferase involved in cell wall biosynthesis
MRVLFDTTYARRAPFSGTAVYLERVAEALARIDGVELVDVANRRRRPPAGGGIGSIRNLLADRWWTAVELPRLATAAGVDVIHHPLPAYGSRSPVPQVVTVLDLAYERLPECFDRGFRTYAGRTHRSAARAAPAVICISETTAADVVELWGIAPRRIVTARLGPGQGVAAAATERTHLLYVGDDEPRKNLATLTEAYGIYRERDRSPLPLVLAGSATATGPGITLERHPGRERLAQLYASAVAVVHPSLYEGFGLTPLEAMSAGAPVIAADAPGVSEVCADAARYADPRDPASFANAITEVAGSENLRRDLAERGRRRVQEFSWDGCARAHLDAYSLALTRE